MVRRCSLVLFLLFAGYLVAQEAPPKTPQFPVLDVYHKGVMTDSFRWLEEESNATRKWVESQNQFAESYFERSTIRPKIETAILKLFEDPPAEYRDIYFENGVLVGKVDDALCVIESVQNPDIKHLLIDPDTFYPNQAASIDRIVLSPNGKTVAALVSVDGFEEGTVYFFDTESGRRLKDELPHASASPGGDLAWKHDSTALYYTRYPNLKQRGKRDVHSYAFEEIWLHEIGKKQEQDIYVMGREFPRYAQVSVIAAPKESHLIASAPVGWGAEGQNLFTWTPGKGTNHLVNPKDEIGTFSYGPDRTILLESCKKAPRGQLLKLSMDDESLEKATVIVPQSERVLYAWWTTKNLIYLVDRLDGTDRIRVIDIDGKEKAKIEFDPFTAVIEMVPTKGDKMLYLIAGYLDAPRWYEYDPDTDRSKKLDMSEEWDTDFGDCEVVRELATSKDGTKVPLDIIRRKGWKADGTNPVLIHGYGGFKMHEQPNFQTYRRLWLDAGGIWVVAHPRGEGELGEEWYRAANRENKLKSAEDFIACAEYLIEKKVSVPEKIGIMGGSNGGLLIGMAVTQRPDLFGAAIGNCGVYDLLRLENEPFGPHLTCEYGTVANGKQYQAMKNASPYHQVKEKTQYPAIWIRTGGNDRRVTPWHSWKMAAKLQSVGSKRPILLTTYPDEGHNFGGSIFDEATFFFQELGMKAPGSRKK
jgi:prolyl oligopeptidase